MLKKQDSISKSKLATKKASMPTPTAQSTEKKEPETFIVQNIMPSYHCVSDLGLTFGPFEVFDLTYEDDSLIKSSKDLRSSMKKGMLRTISQKEWDAITDREIASERSRLAKQQKERKRKMVNIDGNTMEAEEINLNAADAGITADEEVSTAGHMNDPMTYATAFAAISAEYAERGLVMDAATFSNMVDKNPNLIKQYLDAPVSRGRGVTSGVPRNRGKATVMQPPLEDGDDFEPQQIEMSLYSRAKTISNDGLDEMDAGYAEEIDLASDDED